MSKKNYPEEIYTTPTGGVVTSPKKRRMVEKAYDLGSMIGTATREDLEKAYDAGFERGKQAQGGLTGWSNLTEAIKDGERIDWEALDGLPAKCVHPKLGTLTHKLERDICYSETSFNGWYLEPVNLAWENAILDAWQGTCGWSLWVKGDLPIKKRTADELAPGTCFRGRYTEGASSYAYTRAQVVQVNGKPRVMCLNAHFSHVIATYTPAEVEVLEVYGPGTFETPKEDA